MDMKDWNLDTSMRQAVGRSRCELWVLGLQDVLGRRRVGSIFSTHELMVEANIFCQCV